MKQQNVFFIDTLHIFVLFSFAVAQPLFGLLSRNAEFFVARHSEPVDVIFLILILCALLPALVVLIEVVAGLFGQHARKGVHSFMVAILLTVIALPVLNKILELPGAAILVGAAILGVTATITYVRFHAVRMFMTVLSLSLLIFPGLFLFNSPVSKVVFTGEDFSGIYTKVDATAPVIMIVFDEFPVTSLMDEHRQIDPIRYPNFAALARDAYWFSNATTVTESTLLSIPAILSGSYPDPYSIPTAAEHPHTLFTLLGGSYEIKEFESHTLICPETLSGDEKRYQTFVQRMYSMLLDLSAVYFHVALPPDLTAGLPVVTQTWKNFSSKAKASSTMNNVLDRARASYKDRAEIFAKFVESITISDKPTLYFLQIILPHVPWEHLPSGKVYSETGMQIPGLNIKKELWGENDWLVIQGYQRHLLQVGFVDKLVGDLLAKLKALNLYDQSLIVITADHGVNFWSNKSRRGVLKEDLMGILGVPLFIKAPNQHEGIISDRNVKTIDILPTIADMLDIRLPWPVDGHSALNHLLPEGIENVILIRKGVSEPIMFERNLATQYDTLERKLALFGSGAKADGLFKIGPYNNLVGHAVNEAGVENEADVVIELDRAKLYERVDPEGAFVPAQITGRIFNKVDTGDPLNLAVAVNGTIRAMTRTYPQEEDIHEWSAIVPETSFMAGKNDIEIFIVSLVTGKLCLSRTQSQSAVAFSLASGAQGRETIITSDGKSIPVISGALHGFLDRAGVSNDRVKFSGWAADVRNSELPGAIVIFVNEKFFYSGRTYTERPDVVKAYSDASLQRSGFAYALLLEDFKGINNPEVRVFALSKKGIASELHYPKGYKWGRKS